MKRTPCVYVMRDTQGSVLYVGRSVHLPERMLAHKSEKAWWSDVASIDVLHYETRAAMAQGEVDLIRDLQPRWNVTYSPVAVRRPRKVSTVPPSHPISLRIRPELLERVKARAEEWDRSVNWVIVRAVEEWLDLQDTLASEELVS